MTRLIDNDNPAKFLLDNFALTLEAKDTSEENTKYLQNIRIRINEARSTAAETYTALKLRLVKADTNEEILTGRISAKLCRSDVGFAAQCSYSLSFNEKKIDVVSPFFCHRCSTNNRVLSLLTITSYDVTSKHIALRKDRQIFVRE